MYSTVIIKYKLPLTLRILRISNKTTPTKKMHCPISSLL